MSKEKNFSKVQYVDLPEFSDEELERIVANADKDELMRALGFERKGQRNDEK